MSYIQFDNIHKYFGSNHVLKGISLGIEEGELATLLGPSGCGKSTLLRCLSGLETVSEGKIWLDGTDITGTDPRRRNIGMVFQQYSLFPNMDVAKNVAFGLHIQKKSREEIGRKVDEVLEMVGLSDKKGQFPRQLSGGQQQRVALARAIVMEPKVLLLDEPLSAIDALLRKNLQTEIRRIQKELNITTVFVTHDQEEAMVMSDTIHLFNQGNVEQSGKPEEIYSNPRTYFAAHFIGRYNILDSERFAAVSGIRFETEQIAIRPESLRISEHGSDKFGEKGSGILAEETDKGENGNSLLTIRAKILSQIIRGNIISYRLTAEIPGRQGIELNADCLFEKEGKYETGRDVLVSVKKEDIITLG